MDERTHDVNCLSRSICLGVSVSVCLTQSLCLGLSVSVGLFGLSVSVCLGVCVSVCLSRSVYLGCVSVGQETRTNTPTM